ncbi:MAG TPA: helix-turn-helix domain-containing protein [Myxococcota bacterium]|nr:helix-turn-helix domain-containing protein [Myxococcota bacterium]
MASAMPKEAPPTPRKPTRPRKGETQERILRVAVELFATHGYQRTSISAIASRAEVSRPAVFWHFGDKESLFREAFRRMLLPFFGELQRKLAHVDPGKRVFEIFDVYERVVQENRETILAIVRWFLESEALRASLRATLFALHDELMRDFRAAFEELALDAQEADVLSAAVLSMLDGNLLLSLLDPDPRKHERRRAGLRRFTERALRDR